MHEAMSRRAVARNVIAAVVALIVSGLYVEALHWAVDIGQTAATSETSCAKPSGSAAAAGEDSASGCVGGVSGQAHATT